MVMTDFVTVRTSGVKVSNLLSLWINHVVKHVMGNENFVNLHTEELKTD